MSPNAVQEFNRDLSIAVIDQFLRKSYSASSTGVAAASEKKRLRILEALSATGLRSIRYAKEIGGGDGAELEITANDISRRAFESIKRNVEANGVTGTVLPR